MAEVLPPPMQSSTTITLLHSRPASADTFSTSQPYHQPSRLTQAPRSMYNGHNHGYRGSSGPVQPYAFQSTPSQRQENRTSSAPSSSSGPTSGHRTTPSASTVSSDSSSPPPSSKENDSSLPPRTVSLINISQSVPDLSLTSFEPTVKTTPTPDRYRRPTGRRVDSNSSSSTARGGSPAQGDRTTEDVSTPVAAPWLERQTSFDDIGTQKNGQHATGKRYRTRSVNQLDTAAFGSASQTSAGMVQRPASAQDNGAHRSIPLTGSNGYRGVSPSAPAAGDRSAGSTSPASDPAKLAATLSTPKVAVPPRASSEAIKRLPAPSPLSREATSMDSPPASPSPSPTKAKAPGNPTVNSLSPAAQHLAAVSDRDLNKGMKSRLRRAFSFGSAQELRRVAAEPVPPAAPQSRDQQPQQADDEMDAEQLEIARRQEAAGIGAGIYSGQGGFTGSTDNLSISSTASSASMMLRKMGRGAKKGARSIKGLFRPKSVIGVPAADGPIQVGSGSAVEPSVGQVSMVTVEAERQNVNVNAHPDERTGGGTAFPKLERNSLDAATTSGAADHRHSADKGDAHLRRSIIGNDQDRADVLAAVRKGILKRSNTASPTGSPVVRPADGPALSNVPNLTESPQASIPGTPQKAMQARSSSAPVVNGDYFANRMARSVPNTPNGSVRSISFSPRIQFHDAWSSAEYDRRGEIATCNRLTPLLAQQIKEELNTFKMEMEVHELSKPHTHFF